MNGKATQRVERITKMEEGKGGGVWGAKGDLKKSR